jgi:hypothetical protein
MPFCRWGGERQSTRCTGTPACMPDRTRDSLQPSATRARSQAPPGRELPSESEHLWRGGRDSNPESPTISLRNSWCFSRRPCAHGVLMRIAGARQRAANPRSKPTRSLTTRKGKATPSSFTHSHSNRLNAMLGAARAASRVKEDALARSPATTTPASSSNRLAEALSVPASERRARSSTRIRRLDPVDNPSEWMGFVADCAALEDGTDNWARTGTPTIPGMSRDTYWGLVDAPRDTS